MLSLNFQKQVFAAYKNGSTLKRGKFEYTIDYNPQAEIHTWIVRYNKDKGLYDWWCPLNKEIN